MVRGGNVVVRDSSDLLSFFFISFVSFCIMMPSLSFFGLSYPGQCHMSELRANGRAMTRLFNASTRGYTRVMKSNKTVLLDGKYNNITGTIKSYNDELKKYKIKVFNKDVGGDATDLCSTSDIYVDSCYLVPNQRSGIDTHRVQHVIVEVDTLFNDLDFSTLIHISDFKIFKGVERSSWSAAMALWMTTHKEEQKRQKMLSQERLLLEQKQQEYQATHQSVELTDEELLQATMQSNRKLLEKEERERQRKLSRERKDNELRKTNEARRSSNNLKRQKWKEDKANKEYERWQAR